MKLAFPSTVCIPRHMELIKIQNQVFYRNDVRASHMQFTIEAFYLAVQFQTL